MFECIHESTRTDPREPGLWLNNQRVGPAVRIVGQVPGNRLRIEIQHGGDQLRQAVVDLANEHSLVHAGLTRTVDYITYLKSISN